MHLIHPELVHAHRDACMRSARRRRPIRGPRAPGRLRLRAAHVLVVAAQRLEGEPRQSARHA